MDHFHFQIKLEIRDIENVLRGSNMKKSFTTDAFERILGKAVFRQDKMFIYDGMDCVKTYDFKSNGKPRFEDIV